MTTVEQKIKSIVDKMEGITYIFDNWRMANVKLDKVPLPAVINILPVSGSFNLSKSQIKDFPNCLIAFVDKIDLDFDGTEFILRLNESGLFEYVDGDIYYSTTYDRLDVNVAVVAIELKLKEKQGLLLCYGNEIGEMFKKIRNKFVGSKK